MNLPPKKTMLLVLAGFGVVVCAAELIFILICIPTLTSLDDEVIPQSSFIARYAEDLEGNPSLPPLQWDPRKQTLPKKKKIPFIIAEDSRFYYHFGIDPQAIWDAMQLNYRSGKMKVGASTISQQTIKNLFLSPDRSLLRKWHEMILTFLMEIICDKDEIIDTYLNIAEFGQGIYGIENAAKIYYEKSADELDLRETVGLAATLPSPRKNNPGTQTSSWIKRSDQIFQLIENYYSHLYPEYFSPLPSETVPNQETSSTENFPKVEKEVDEIEDSIDKGQSDPQDTEDTKDESPKDDAALEGQEELLENWTSPLEGDDK